MEVFLINNRLKPMRLFTMELWILVVFLVLALLLPRIGSGLDAKAEFYITSKLVAIISVDDSGLLLGFPSRVDFDPSHSETYVYSSNGRITVYDKTFFPLGSIGVGRGAEAVNAMAVSPQGNLYLCRGKSNSVALSSPRITIYNQAFFVEREILLEDIPELVGFVPIDIAVAFDGTIYLAGSFIGYADLARGVVVLDSEGKFKTWLAPTGLVLRENPLFEDAGEESAKLDTANIKEEENDFFDPFKPISKGVEAVDTEEGNGEEKNVFLTGAVSLAHVSIDSTGRVYLLSTETSEVFVYNSKHKFLFKFGTKGGAKGKLSTPRALAVDYPRRIIYVADFMRHTILVYDYDDGRFIYEFGGLGTQPLWFQFPNDIAVDKEGMVIVADLFNKRVQVVDPTTDDRPIVDPIVPQEAEVPVVPINSKSVEFILPLPLQLMVGEVRSVQSPSVIHPGEIPRLTLREIDPVMVKKKIELVVKAPPHAMRLADPVTFVIPAPMSPPIGFEVEAVSETENIGTGLKTINALRAVVGVYGPVAVMLGVGGWILRRRQ